MDARIQQSVVVNLSRRPAPVEVGPFVIGLDPTTTSPYVNYATPRPGAAVTAADVAALVAAFHAADRRPRLEYVTSCVPDLEALLTAAGFTVEARHTYLVCVPDTLASPPVPDHLSLCEPATDSQRAALISVQNEAFGGDPAVSGADVARLRRQQDAGGVVVMAVTVDGGCAGGGGAAAPSARSARWPASPSARPSAAGDWRPRSPPTSPGGCSTPVRRSPGWRPAARIRGGSTSASATGPAVDGSTQRWTEPRRGARAEVRRPRPGPPRQADLAASSTAGTGRRPVPCAAERSRPGAIRMGRAGDAASRLTGTTPGCRAGGPRSRRERRRAGPALPRGAA